MLRIALLFTIAFSWSPPALAADTAHVPGPDNVIVIAAACPTGDVPACAYADQGLVYVEPGQDRFAFWHEIGHVFDYQRLTPGDRNWFTRMVGLAGTWDQGTGLEGLTSPKERFADAYAACALDWRPDRGQWAVAYGYQPTLKRHRQICGAIDRIGARG